ncbi:MFS transporter [Niallia circulans]|uniref:DHA2 family efflux MFS transporter permease subunit n=1 Tax=Niallia TaxID=2837506 RepID=UPI000BA59E09|nr:DHA2 family efflux MFS transporter permease subunit [Niallia circulans]PAD88128.1 MFS transporter [Niallia circulans]
MTTYITSYIIGSILLLLIINLFLRKKKTVAKPSRVMEDAKKENDTTSSLTKSEMVKQEESSDTIEHADAMKEDGEDGVAEAMETNEGISDEKERLANAVESNEIADEEEQAAEAKESKKAKAPYKPLETAEEINRGKVIVALMLGAFVAILNQTLLNVAIPHIMNDLNVSTSTVQWLSTGYMLTNGVFIPITPFLINKLGTRKLLISAISAFTIGSIVCATSVGFSMLLIGRIIQAAGAGLLMPLLMTVFLIIFPPEKRGTAMGIMGVVMIFAPAIGPTLSGWLIGHYSWRVLFELVIPIGILDLIIAILWMKDVTKVSNPVFDTIGFITCTVGLGSLLYGFSEAGNNGWDSRVVVLSLVIGVIFLCLFVWRELTTEAPMVDLRVFKYSIFTLTTLVSMIVNMAMFAAMLLLPIYLQNIRGFTALDSGLLMLPGAIVMGIMSPISGKLFDRFGARPLAIIGLIITVLTTWGFTQLTMQTSYSHLMMLYIFRMFGMSFIMMTVMTEGMNQLPLNLTSHGTAVSNTARTVAGSIGTAFLITVMTNRTAFHLDNYNNIISSANPYIAEKFAQLGQGLAGLTGLPTGAGQTLAISTVYGKAAQASTISGINDAFIVATIIASVALVLSFFIRRATASSK